jgi:hypothetical protein
MGVREQDGEPGVTVPAGTDGTRDEPRRVVRPVRRDA